MNDDPLFLDMMADVVLRTMSNTPAVADGSALPSAFECPTPNSQPDPRAQLVGRLGRPWLAGSQPVDRAC